LEGKLILENGLVFEGRAFGYLHDSVGEVVFNTAMSGYQEILTDPSYQGQIVIMTYPAIGNYGVNLSDMQSSSSKIKGVIVRELCANPSNYRYEIKLQDYLKQNKVIGIENIDTRQLVKIIRSIGTMKGIITTKKLTINQINNMFDNFTNKDAVQKVTTNKVYTIDGSGSHVAVLDFGIKTGILDSFRKRGCKLTVFPANASSDEILKVNPDLIFLSNGPGDPKDLTKAIENIKTLAINKPICGICLGHQLLAIALGGETKKLKFGHRGCNHPVKDLENNRVYITSQNHGYFVEKLPDEMVATHLSMNDSTIEGMRHIKLPIYSVQFHPEAYPGPRDSDGVFDKFLSMIK
jgi:carbamoyl-phosphate synthase small subunit